jgi:hypothetical protein
MSLPLQIVINLYYNQQPINNKQQKQFVEKNGYKFNLNAKPYQKRKKDNKNNFIKEFYPILSQCKVRPFNGASNRSLKTKNSK